MNLNEYNRLMLKFCSISNELMNSTSENAVRNLEKLKNILEEDAMLRDVILKPIKDTKFDYKSEKFKKNEYGNAYKLNPPVDELEHLKAIYDYMTDLVLVNEKNILSESFDFKCPWTNKNQFKKFLKELFNPLCEYICRELSIKIQELEREERSMENKDSGIVNYGVVQQIQADVKGDVIASGRDTTYTKTIYDYDKLNIEEIIKLIKSILEKESMDIEVKGELTDDIDLISEQLNQQEPKLTRIKKALRNITTNISKGFITGAALVSNLETFKKAIEKLFPPN